MAESDTDWMNTLLGLGASAGINYFGLDDPDIEKTGYQGTIPEYDAVQQRVPGVFDPRRRPGSSGQRYFTDTQFVPKGTAPPLPTAAQLAASNAYRGPRPAAHRQFIPGNRGSYRGDYNTYPAVIPGGIAAAAADGVIPAPYAAAADGVVPAPYAAAADGVIPAPYAAAADGVIPAPYAAAADGVIPAPYAPAPANAALSAGGREAQKQQFKDFLVANGYTIGAGSTPATTAAPPAGGREAQKQQFKDFLVANGYTIGAGPDGSALILDASSGEPISSYTQDGYGSGADTSSDGSDPTSDLGDLGDFTSDPAEALEGRSIHADLGPLGIETPLGTFGLSNALQAAKMMGVGLTGLPGVALGAAAKLGTTAYDVARRNDTTEQVFGEYGTQLGLMDALSSLFSPFGGTSLAEAAERNEVVDTEDLAKATGTFEGQTSLYGDETPISYEDLEDQARGAAMLEAQAAQAAYQASPAGRQAATDTQAANQAAADQAAYDAAISAAQTAYDTRIANSTTETVDPSTDFETWDDFLDDISVEDKADKERDAANAAADQAAADAANAAADQESAATAAEDETAAKAEAEAEANFTAEVNTAVAEAEATEADTAVAAADAAKEALGDAIAAAVAADAVADAAQEALGAAIGGPSAAIATETNKAAVAATAAKEAKKAVDTATETSDAKVAAGEAANAVADAVEASQRADAALQEVVGRGRELDEYASSQAWEEYKSDLAAAERDVANAARAKTKAYEDELKTFEENWQDPPMSGGWGLADETEAPDAAAAEAAVDVDAAAVEDAPEEYEAEADDPNYAINDPVTVENLPNLTGNLFSEVDFDIEIAANEAAAAADAAEAAAAAAAAADFAEYGLSDETEAPDGDDGVGDAESQEGDGDGSGGGGDDGGGAWAYGGSVTGIAGLKSGRYLGGATDGMADKIPTTIDGKQKAALSHGEFVIPADIVSHLGNGNSDAGAKTLYAMMDRIRQARTGSKKQGKKIKPRKFLPV